jgi:hypothetical protein
VTGDPRSSVAVVRDQATSKLVHLHIGESVSGWSLRALDAKTMTIAKNSEMVTLDLPAPGSVQPGPPPVMEAFRTRRPPRF